MAADTSVLFARPQQGEEAVTGVDVVFSNPLCSVQTPHFTDVTDARLDGY